MIAGLVAVILGIAVMVAAVVSGRRAQQRAIDELLGMAAGPGEAEDDDDGQVTGLADRAVVLAGQMVDRVDRKRSFAEALDRARIPLRPGEYVVVTIGLGLGVSALLLAVFDHLLVAPVGVVLGAAAAWTLVRRRIARRRKKFEAQLADALSLVASSLSAGHTFLRAIQMMTEESDPPMSEEFSRIVAETRLGDSVVDALDRMAERLDIRDFDMVVQAIRIQQTVGGKLADLLHTLADFIRAREELRREVKVLTAEGRMSAYVLAGMVPFLLAVINMMNPEYIKPMYSGWGLVVLAACAGSVLMGMLLILRMVKIDV